MQMQRGRSADIVAMHRKGWRAVVILDGEAIYVRTLWTHIISLIGF